MRPSLPILSVFLHFPFFTPYYGQGLDDLTKGVVDDSRAPAVLQLFSVNIILEAHMGVGLDGQVPADPIQIKKDHHVVAIFGAQKGDF